MSDFESRQDDDIDPINPESVETRFAGGGGGNPGATMISRLQEVLPGMGPEEAADTGGQAILPSEIVPLASAGELPENAIARPMRLNEPSAGSESVSADTPGEQGAYEPECQYRDP
ncbi:MAG: hypothetical protein ACLGIN_07620, partial [Candidatus Sericytochromatia bacterium]